MSKIKLGAYNTLTVLKVALREGNGEPFGLYLDGGPEGEILMPQKYVPEGTEMVMPGDNVRISVELIAPVALEEGTRFAIREGGRTVGSGVVSKILG